MEARIPTNHTATREYSQNIVHHLWQRESGNRRAERNFVKSITPNLTIQNVDKPLGYLRKFTPNGSKLLSFSADQKSLEVYDYKGVGSAADLLVGQQTECITAADHSLDSLRIRQQIYERMLQLRWSIRLAPDTVMPCHLNREFSIFLDDGRYVLLSAMATSIEQPPVTHIMLYPDLYHGCDFFTYIFYLVDLEQGCKSDELVFKHDCIMLSHNHGVSAFNQRIAVLSKFRQCIELLELVNGKLVTMYEIGPFGCRLDASEIQPVYETDAWLSTLPLSHLKQRILVYLYNEALLAETEPQQRKQLSEFYKMFRIYENMIISKMQLIDVDNLLLRFEPRPSLSFMQERVITEHLEFKLYVFYNISTQTVFKIFPQNSISLLYYLRDFCDTFRNARSLQTQRPSSSPSNNPYFRAAFNSAITSIAGGQAEAALRFNATLPISTQSFATTQYLDYSLFNYDDRLISALERPKNCSAEPIRFSDRDTNITKFRLYLEPPTSDLLYSNISMAMGNNMLMNRELVAFIFHPYEPFIISIQKLSMRYVVNFHIYNMSTIVQQ